MLGFNRRQRKQIGERIDRWQPLVLARIPNGWRATVFTRTGQFTATAITVRAAQVAAATRAQQSFAL
jgi:Flp pilus assembly CpaF family ATPase